MPASASHQGRSHSLLKTAFVCVALLIAGAGVIYVIFNTEPTAERDGAVRQSASLVDVTQAEVGNFRPSIVAMGTVRPTKEIVLSARVQGEIISISADFVPGGYVAANQTLLQLDDADYDIQLQRARTALEQALADLEIEQAERSAAQADYERLERQLPPERKALVLREPQGRAARAAVEAARADVRQAELNLARTGIAAPFEAHVLSREANLGSQVGPGAPLGRLVGLDTFWVEATLPVARLAWLATSTNGGDGSAALIRNRTAWPAGVVRTGKVAQVISELEGSTRLARVLIAVEDPLGRSLPADTPRLMLGEFVEATIEGRELTNVARLPREFVRANDVVWLNVHGRLEIRPVSVVFQDERFAYIDEGLDAEDRVVTTRLATVREGLRLRVDDGASPSEESQTP
jgi:RND family efflux transporter MFP subunit